MRSIARALLFACIAISANAQTNSLYRRADSLARVKDFRSAASTYREGMGREGSEIPAWRYSSLAGLWAQAGESDSAFSCLAPLTDSKTTNKLISHDLEFGTEFNSLRTDKRWTSLFNRVKSRAEANGYAQTEIVYGRKDGVALSMVQIKPKVRSNGKAIISVVSGSWYSSYNGIEMNTTYQEQYLARGFTVFAVVHGSNPRFAIPDAINDIKRSVRYIRFNARSLGVDPDKIGITGSSAGGHLSLAVATSDEQVNTVARDPVDRVSSRVQAVAVLFPPTDFQNWGGPGLNMVNVKELLKVNKVWGAMDFREWNDKFMFYEEVADTSARNKIGKEISPVNHVSSDDPPVFIIHGDSDKTVPLQQSQAIIAKFNDAGVKNRLVVKKGADHIMEQMKPEYLEFAEWFELNLR
jgi:acetyl esterase/lipase